MDAPLPIPLLLPLEQHFKPSSSSIQDLCTLPHTPSVLCCPVTCTLYEDPVFVTTCKMTVSRAVLKRDDGRLVDPNNVSITQADIHPDIGRKRDVDEYVGSLILPLLETMKQGEVPSDRFRKCITTLNLASKHIDDLSSCADFIRLFVNYFKENLTHILPILPKMNYSSMSFLIYDVLVRKGNIDYELYFKLPTLQSDSIHYLFPNCSYAALMLKNYINTTDSLKDVVQLCIFLAKNKNENIFEDLSRDCETFEIDDNAFCKMLRAVAMHAPEEFDMLLANVKFKDTDDVLNVLKDKSLEPSMRVLLIEQTRSTRRMVTTLHKELTEVKLQAQQLAEENNVLKMRTANNKLDWEGARVVGSDPVILSDLIEIDPSCKYKVSIEMRSTGCNRSQVHWGLMCMDENGSTLLPHHMLPYGDPAVVFSVAAPKNEVFVVYNVESLKYEKSTTDHPGLGFYFDGKTEGRVPDAVVVSKKAGVLPVVIEGNSIRFNTSERLCEEMCVLVQPGVTKVRMQCDGYPLITTSAPVVTPPSCFQKYTGTFSGESFGNKFNTFRKGTKYVKICMMPHYCHCEESSAHTALEYRNIKFKQEE